ncbi:MAG: SufS family cysteine desulfurase [Acidobacteriota bacterium]
MTSDTSMPASTPFDVEHIRQDFPALDQDIRGHRLVYLDNAASTHKPKAVLDTLAHFYGDDYANVHRGVHTLSQRATDAYEAARERCRRLLGATDEREIVYTRGTTDGINLVARSFVAPRLEPGDEILISAGEHHANIVPWQMIAGPAGARVVVAPIDEQGVIDLDALRDLFSPRTKIFAIQHVSNALGTIHPVAEMAAMARNAGVPILVDGAQAAPHLALDVEALGVDFYAFSGHKLFGPTGIGVLWGRYEHLESMPPVMGGGDMIETVSFKGTTYTTPPVRFEGGTPHIAGAIGLAAAIDYLDTLDMDAIEAHERALLESATEKVGAVPGVRLLGTAADKVPVLSFLVDGAHAHDVGTILDHSGIAIRVGHHCAQPLMKHLGVVATARASFAFYNTLEEIDALVAGLTTVSEIFGRGPSGVDHE